MGARIGADQGADWGSDVGWCQTRIKPVLIDDKQLAVRVLVRPKKVAVCLVYHIIIHNNTSILHIFAAGTTTNV